MKRLYNFHMWKNKDIFNAALKGAKSHIARAKEGKRLLQKGKPLSEMEEPIVGLSADQNVERRQEYLELINQMNPSQLQERLSLIEQQLEIVLKTERKGTSELEWKRNAIHHLLDR